MEKGVRFFGDFTNILCPRCKDDLTFVRTPISKGLREWDHKKEDLKTNFKNYINHLGRIQSHFWLYIYFTYTGHCIHEWL